MPSSIPSLHAGPLHHLVGDVHLEQLQVTHNPLLNLHAELAIGGLGPHGTRHLANGGRGRSSSSL